MLAGKFARWTADEQKSKAFTMKQQRMHQEEEDKRKSLKEKGPEDGKDKN